MAFSACTPYPCPREIAFKNFCFVSAKLMRLFIGSVPGRMNIKGYVELESLKISGKLKGGGEVNFSPSSVQFKSYKSIQVFQTKKKYFLTCEYKILNCKCNSVRPHCFNDAKSLHL